LKKNSIPATSIVGREAELLKLRACLRAGKNVLLEGPVGVGKTSLALEMTRELGRPVFRVDGDNRYSEQKLSGWFDPPSVIQRGYTADTFMPGPLVDAMRKGGVLFINELNRLPEGVQNVLLPAIDERLIVVPRLGEVRAEKGFLVIATQNPKEFVATSHLSEAILDRFELITLDYQTEEEETEIVVQYLKRTPPGRENRRLAQASVKLVRLTRSHPRVRRGASVRAALSVSEITSELMVSGLPIEEAFFQAALLALPTRIEFERDAESEVTPRAEMEALLKEWTDSVWQELGSSDLKKK
jgi:MoxR-like ATPase